VIVFLAVIAMLSMISMCVIAIIKVVMCNQTTKAASYQVTKFIHYSLFTCPITK